MDSRFGFLCYGSPASRVQTNSRSHLSQNWPWGDGALRWVGSTPLLGSLTLDFSITSHLAGAASSRDPLLA